MAVMLLDTASLYFRAYFGVPESMTAPDGRPVNAIRGLLDFIGRLVTDHSPDLVVACWDDDWRPQWRVDLLPTYKAHRVADVVGSIEEVPDTLAPQVPIIPDVLAALGVPRVGAAGFEADDVIGTYATLAAAVGRAVDVVTGDRDLFQLVDDDASARVIYTARSVAKPDLVTTTWLRAKYGITGAQYADFATLRGDASDGLPGVTGIGEKTAATLINTYGAVDAIVAAAQDPASAMKPRQREALLAARDYLTAASRVVRVRTDVPLPPLPAGQPAADPDKLAQLDARWGLGGSLGRAVAALEALRA